MKKIRPSLKQRAVWWMNSYIETSDIESLSKVKRNVSNIIKILMRINRKLFLKQTFNDNNNNNNNNNKIIILSS